MSSASHMLKFGRLKGVSTLLMLVALTLAASAQVHLVDAGTSTVGSNCQLTTPPSPTIITEGGVKKIRGIAYMKCLTTTHVNSFYSKVYDATPQQNVLASSPVYGNFTAQAGVTYAAEAKSACSGRGISGPAQTYVSENTATDVKYNTSPWANVYC
jgi:hypothetical protein